MKINNITTESKPGLIMLNIRETIRWVKNKARDNFLGQMDPNMKEIFSIIIFKDKEFMSGLMVEFTKENGKIIKWMVMENLPGVTAENMLEIVKY